MKYLATIFLCFVIGGIIFYNSNWFQSFFLYERFYEDIYNGPFDVTRKGEFVSVPLKYKYKTCYRLAIAIPDKDVFHDRIVGQGLLAYRIVSNDNVVFDGITHEPNRHRMSLKDGVSTINILVFDLPFSSADKDLTLELEVLEPFKFLEPFAGTINCKINPDYTAKFNKCYNEDLRIVSQ